MSQMGMATEGRRVEQRPRSPFTLSLALPVSLLLHGVLVGALWRLTHTSTPPPSSRPLDLHLLGMLSERQVEQQTRARPTPVTPSPHPLASRQETTRRPMAHAHASPSPVQVAEQPKPVLPQADASPPAPLAPPAKPAQEDRQQQTIQPRESEADILRRYLLGLRKAIQRHLLYPPDAKAAGLVGSPMVRFTLTEQGEILPGSLAIRQSSGSTTLDEQALRAALASAPFDKPPRRMDVSLAIAFVQDK